jgi:uroporphyrinogen decarboxylase
MKGVEEGMTTSRELVYQALNFECPQRTPRQMWVLPWTRLHLKSDLDAILQAYPSDFAYAPVDLAKPTKEKGAPYTIGQYTDAWGCVFENLQAGIIGEVRDPVVKDFAADRAKVHIPKEWLTFDVEKVNAFCGETDKFVLTPCFIRPFEQLQFIMGTAELYMELMDPSDEFIAFLKEMHGFYCEVAERWSQTRVDALYFMDDWGSQNDLLINPLLWSEMFMPMYRDYIEIAHRNGKKAFMHSDGNILKIFPKLVDLGLDAINSQIFCMGLENLAPFAGKITFWGEMDRQHLLVSGSAEDVRAAVGEVIRQLCKNGGCIAQCEFGPGARPENIRAVFTAWDERE